MHMNRRAARAIGKRLRLVGMMMGLVAALVPPASPALAATWYSNNTPTATIHTLGTSNTGVVTVHFDVTPLRSLIDGVIGYTDSSTTITDSLTESEYYTKFSVLIRLNNTGTFDARNGSSYQALTSLSYSANNTYHVKLLVNLPYRNYTVWVTPPGGSARLIAENFAFRTDGPATNDLGKLGMRSDVDNDYRIDNHIVTLASAEPLDKFGVDKIYASKPGGNEWYVNMQDPASDLYLQNLDGITFTHFSDNTPYGYWKVVQTKTAGDMRLEAWSPANRKWLNVEVTAYARITNTGSMPTTSPLFQMYARGGHHTDTDPCLGGTYKGRLYWGGSSARDSALVKEVFHDAYTPNQAEVNMGIADIRNRWIGFKLTMYNFVSSTGVTAVRIKTFIDNDVTDANGNLVVRNNWVLASDYTDRGGWSAANDPDWDPNLCPSQSVDNSGDREADEILSLPGGTSTQNIAAWRSDDGTQWQFKYLSVREIQP